MGDTLPYRPPIYLQAATTKLNGSNRIPITIRITAKHITIFQLDYLYIVVTRPLIHVPLGIQRAMLDPTKSMA